MTEPKRLTTKENDHLSDDIKYTLVFKEGTNTLFEGYFGDLLRLKNQTNLLGEEFFNLFNWDVIESGSKGDNFDVLENVTEEKTKKRSMKICILQ